MLGSEIRIRFAHVQLFIEEHAKVSKLIDVPVLPGVQRQALPPDHRVALGQSDNVAGTEVYGSWRERIRRLCIMKAYSSSTSFLTWSISGLAPNRDINTGRLIGHLERAHLAVLLSHRGIAHLQDNELYVDVLQPGPDVFDGDAVVRVHFLSNLANGSLCSLKHYASAIRLTRCTQES